METPKSLRKPRTTRNPTPRLSERKKSLFSDGEIKVAGNDMLEGIELLDSSHISENNNINTRSRRNIEKLLDSNHKSSTISFLNDALIDTEKPVRTSPLRRSPRTKCVKINLQNIALKIPSGKENAPNTDQADCSDEQLQKMFKSSMTITCNSTPEIINGCPVLRSEAHKRSHESTEENLGLSPHKKTQKISSYDEVSATISTTKFYSTSRPTNLCSEVQKNMSAVIKSPPLTSKNISPRTRSRRSFGQININKGVKHKIRRPVRTIVSGKSSVRGSLSSVDIDTILKNVRNENLKNRIASKRVERQNIEKIHNIFRSCKNPIEMARPLTVISGIDDTNNNISEYVLSTSKNDQEIQMVEDIDTDFSDIDSNFDEYEEISNAEEIIPLISHEPATIEAAIVGNDSLSETASVPTKKKFFKSGRSNNTPKEIRITDNIRASVCNGKLSLIQEEKKIKKKPKRRTSTTYDISDEQATVEAILKNLDDTAYGDMDEDSKGIVANQSICEQTVLPNHSLQTPDMQLSTDLDYLQFRRRLPYNTTDPSVIEQQHLLLDFLINNNMCTEENFTIFIADPDNHKEEAAKIVDQVFVLVNEQEYFRQRLPYNTNDPEVEGQQHRMLDFLIENNICTEETFDIFIANYNQRRKEADEIMQTLQKTEKENVSLTPLQDVDTDVKIQSNISETSKPSDKTEGSVQQRDDEPRLPLPRSSESDKRKLFPIFYSNPWKPLQQQSKRDFSRTLNLGRGANQYQIDAGQRYFGAHQCKQCGLVYSIHEAEEEKLHRDYHASLHLLRFKGWIDEDIVAIYPEWGADGRILRITESSHNRRHERLADVLKIVDKELGFASYVIPSTFIAYLAVRKYQIVGLCLVVPLEKANKYIKVDGIDCCTEEEYPAKCGISRIWVSPLHRRLHIATKLINAVQQNTIFGEEIPLDLIAFSAPTEAGRKLAQKVTQTDNFLVYQ